MRSTFYVIPLIATVAVSTGEEVSTQRTLHTAQGTNVGDACYFAWSYCSNAVALGDVNGDGLADVALGYSEDWSRRSTAPSMCGAPPSTQPTGFGVVSHAASTALWYAGNGVFAAGDLDGDGLSDLWQVRRSAAGVAFFDARRGFDGLVLRSIRTVDDPCHYGVLGDIDLDGVLDVFACGPNQISFFSGRDGRVLRRTFCRCNAGR